VPEPFHVRVPHRRALGFESLLDGLAADVEDLDNIYFLKRLAKFKTDFPPAFQERIFDE
jgi:hypothetical protein